jgi:hypothetical protein
VKLRRILRLTKPQQRMAEPEEIIEVHCSGEAMITKSANTIRIKLFHYLRYYEKVHGVRLSPEQGERQARAEGFVID